MASQRLSKAVVALAVVFVTGQAAQAGRIGAVLNVSGAGTAGAAAITPAPNNDDAGPGNPNTVTVDKEFLTMGPIDIVFEVLDTGGTTEYQFRESVTNSTGIDWLDYHVALGFGTGAAFVPSGDFDFIHFDQPYPQNPPSSHSHFATNLPQANPDTIDFFNGLQAVGQIATVSFPVDVPDHNNIPAAYHITGPSGSIFGYEFTLRQFPTITGPPVVPVPAALPLGLAGLGLLAVVKRFRQR